jgi:DNA repair and recombination protein RAD52
MRRIGAPNSPSPMANRNSYKPPSKRPVDSRAPLVDLPANGTVGLADQGGDMKRQRLNG